MTAFPESFTVGHRVYSESGDDGFGNAIGVWASPVDRAVFGVYPGTPGEDYEPGRNPSEIPMFVLGSADELGDMQARDRIDFEGATFEVDGAVENFNFGPFSWTPGVRVRLMRVEG